MFIIGKNLDNCDDVVSMMIGEENFNLINDYLNNYYSVCFNDQELREKNYKVRQEEKRLLSLCYSGMGIFPFINLAKLNAIGNSVDSAKDAANEVRKKLQMSLYKLQVNDNDIKESNVYERLKKTHDLHAWCKFMNPEIVETTEDDLLLDVVLNNELDLIKDYLEDYRTLDFDVRLAKKKGKANINHNFTDLDLRFQNIVFQNEVLEIYQRSNQDASLMNEIFTESYGLLKKSLSEGVTDTEINDYKDMMNFEIENDKELNMAVKKYVATTLDTVVTYRKKTTHKKKAK